MYSSTSTNIKSAILRHLQKLTNKNKIITDKEYHLRGQEYDYNAEQFQLSTAWLINLLGYLTFHFIVPGSDVSLLHGRIWQCNETVPLTSTNNQPSASHIPWHGTTSIPAFIWPLLSVFLPLNQCFCRLTVRSTSEHFSAFGFV